MKDILFHIAYVLILYIISVKISGWMRWLSSKIRIGSYHG